MGEVNRMKQMFKIFFQMDEGGKNNSGPKNRRFIFILALIGIILIFVGKSCVKDEQTTEKLNPPIVNNESREQAKNNDHETKEAMLVYEIEQTYEKHLEEMLNKMAGVSEAEVMVNLDSTNINVFAQNIIHGQQTTDETDRNGGERKVEDQTEETQIVLTRDRKSTRL